MATTSTNLVNTLGAGSGIDIKALAQGLVDAEKTPRKDRIDAKIKAEEGKISGQSAIKFALTQLQTALGAINDAREFSSVNISNSQPNAFTATTTTGVTPGRYSVTVSAVALGSRLASDLLPNTTDSLGLSNATTFDMKVGGVLKQIPITASDDSPAGLVSAINRASADTGISAQLVKNGSGYTMVFSGPTGLGKTLTLVNPPTALTHLTTLQSPQDASLSINGLPLTSASNTLTDVMPGLTLELTAPTTDQVPATLDVTRQSGTIKDKLKQLVTAYNDFEDTLTTLGDPKSPDTQFGGTLAGDSLLQTVRTQIRQLIFSPVTVYKNDDSNQAALNPNVNAAWQVGVSFDRFGKMTFDETKLDKALSANFDQVVTFFTANRNDQSIYTSLTGGMAGNAYKRIDAMLRTSGIVQQQTDTANKRISTYKEELTKLDDQMQKLLERYTQQFTAMDSLVGTMNKTRDSLKSSFDGMMAVYTKN